jgi:hypothetical protein
MDHVLCDAHARTLVQKSQDPTASLSFVLLKFQVETLAEQTILTSKHLVMFSNTQSSVFFLLQWLLGTRLVGLTTLL